MAKPDAPRPVPVEVKPTTTLKITRYVKEQTGWNQYDVVRETLECKVVKREKVETAQTLAVAHERLRSEEAKRVKREALL